ncbi:MAG: NUDIX hydrolase [Proteobacteria bacterium]|nr:NUDIX hydrolase [Pseudomonadota bacterium]
MARLPADRPADVELGQPDKLADAFRDYWRYHLTLRNDGQPPLQQQRDILIGGKVIAVLPVDLERDEVVLIRQFRLPAHIGTGKGDMVEIVAGRIEPGETPEVSASRECVEEIGVAPDRLVELFSFMTTPGITDETIMLFLASVDAARVPAQSGAADEGERIETIRLPIDDAVALVQGGGVANGPLILALQWLALNRTRLGELLQG